jgi:hypothetical protein
LKDKNIEMTKEFLSTVLRENFSLWQQFNEELVNHGLALEWRWYKDGGWLAKITHKTKTIIWGSVSDGYFSASFNFSAKPELLAKFQALDIVDEIKKSVEITASGKYAGLTVDVHNENQLADVWKIVEFKKKA